ncbi:hypothetical protein [Atopobacter phocae]|uniref:hypothetical protein n=1 Tax=Atopobacter phocae TaxID=136492 RepID=UPI0004712CEF|nr:hypothetical protein [Atopobacter phocae]
MTNQEFMKEIDKLIEQRTDGFLNESQTFKEALKKAKSSRLSFSYGELGQSIDSAVYDKIVDLSVSQSIRF